MWLAAEHDWKPSTWQGYRQAARRLTADPIARRAPATVSPPVLGAAMNAWERDGVPTTTATLRGRTLKAALGWAFDERLLACQPLQGMRGPGQPEPRRDVPLIVVRELLEAAAGDVAQLASAPPSVRGHDHSDVCWHRLRHTVATVLVADGQLLQAQQRLGHAEASTTLRQYCRALPLHDEDVADQLGSLLDNA